jgi:hypothetical protein
MIFYYPANGNRSLAQIIEVLLYMNLETTRLRCRQRNRWLDEVREDEKIVSGEEWQEKVYTERNRSSS